MRSSVTKCEKLIEFRYGKQHLHDYTPKAQRRWRTDTFTTSRYQLTKGFNEILTETAKGNKRFVASVWLEGKDQNAKKISLLIILPWSSVWERCFISRPHAMASTVTRLLPLLILNNIFLWIMSDSSILCYSPSDLLPSPLCLNISIYIYRERTHHLWQRTPTTIGTSIYIYLASKHISSDMLPSASKRFTSIHDNSVRIERQPMESDNRWRRGSSLVELW